MYERVQIAVDEMLYRIVDDIAGELLAMCSAYPADAQGSMISAAEYEGMYRTPEERLALIEGYACELSDRAFDYLTHQKQCLDKLMLHGLACPACGERELDKLVLREQDRTLACGECGTDSTIELC